MIFDIVFPCYQLSHWYSRWNWKWKVWQLNHSDQRKLDFYESRNRLLGEEIWVLPGVKYFHLVDKAIRKTVKENVFWEFFFYFLWVLNSSVDKTLLQIPISSDRQGHWWKKKFDVYLLIEPWISIKLCTSENRRGSRVPEYPTAFATVGSCNSIKFRPQ